MNYEPCGKVAILADAMRVDPSRIWSSAECSEVMKIHQGALTAHLDAAIRNGAIFRKLVNGRCQYSLKPFVAEPQVNGYVPPQMIPPRGTTAPAATTQRGTWDPHAVLAKLDILHQVHRELDAPLQQIVDGNKLVADGRKRLDEELTKVVKPQPASVLADASIPEAAAPDLDETEVEPEEEEGGYDAFYSCLTGELQLVGLLPDEDGRIVIPKDLLAAIRRQIAWMPA